MASTGNEGGSGMRLDKWLWAARFFKTRALAIEAINGGKVHVNGQRAKPSKEVRPGTRLRVHKGSLEWELEVLALNDQRRPAPEAALLYREDPDSQQRRAAYLEERRLLGSGAAQPPTRPNKRDRRLIRRFTEGEG